jgi:hypothetical protein
MKQLLREVEAQRFDPEDVAKIKEQNNGKIILKCQLSRANVVNANNRYYSKTLLEREEKKYQELIKARNSLGELDHPEASVVSLQNVSHLISKAWWEGDNLMGEIEVLNTPYGTILQSLIEQGVLIGVSSRAVGSTQQTDKGYELVQEDLQIICWDVISTPSSPGSWIMTENKIYIDSKVDNYLRFIDSAQSFLGKYKK